MYLLEGGAAGGQDTEWTEPRFRPWFSHYVSTLSLIESAPVMLLCSPFFRLLFLPLVQEDPVASTAPSFTWGADSGVKGALPEQKQLWGEWQSGCTCSPCWEHPALHFS